VPARRAGNLGGASPVKGARAKRYFTVIWPSPATAAMVGRTAGVICAGLQVQIFCIYYFIEIFQL